MKKELLIGAIATVTCFSLAGCGEQGKTNNGSETENSNVNTEITEVQKSNAENTKNELDKIDLTSDDKKIVFTYNDTVSSVYYYSGDKVTNMESYIKYENQAEAELAKIAYESEEADEDIESVSVNGNYLVVKYKEDSYKDVSVEDLKTSYALMKQIQNAQAQDAE